MWALRASWERFTMSDYKADPSPGPHNVSMAGNREAEEATYAVADRARELSALQALESSADSMRLLAKAVEKAQDVVLITEAEPVSSPGPRILYVNEAFERMTGYSAAEVIGKTPRILQGPNSDRAALGRIRDALVAWQPVREELINYRKDGTEFYVELSIVPIADEKGWYTHWIAIQRETTEQNVVRARLQESESRLRTLTETIPQLLWTASPEGRCEYISESCADYLGARPGQILVDGWINFIHPDDRASTLEHWAEAIANSSTFICEYRLRRRDGQYIWFMHRAQPRRDLNGMMIEWIGTSTDIAVQKRSEQAIRQTEKLAAVSRLASAISHEINNPLEGITNLLYLIDAEPSLSLQTREYLTMAQQQLARISEVTVRSLRFHRQSTSAALTPLAELVDQVLTAHRSQLMDKGIAISRRYDSQAAIRCFAQDIRQAMGHIISNAIDAMRQRDQLVLRVRRSHGWISGRDGVRVTIADTGVGIPEGDRPEIFEAFFTTKGIVGTGLGLWLTRDIVERHQGKIRIRSSTRPGRTGTAVMVFFPAEVTPRALL